MTEARRQRVKVIFILGVVLVAMIVMFYIPRIPQDPSYHNFVDQRRLFGIPNFWNIATNIPFIIAGALGLYVCNPNVPHGGIPELGSGYRVFFLGILLVGFGSAYYHYNPSTQTLLWDRLPMTVAFMAFLCVIIGEHISVRVANKLLAPTLMTGLGTVIYWHVTEAMGVGDLRPYGLVQFLPMVLIPLILVLFPSRLSNNGYIWVVLGAYVASKIAEHQDATVYHISGIISGHSVKHLFASSGALLMVLALIRRRERISMYNRHVKL
jgi:hypothetical protein